MKKTPEKTIEQPTPQESVLFKNAMEGVILITPSNRITATPVAPRIQTRNALLSPTVTDSFSDHNISEVAPTSYVRSGLNNMTLRKLRRGFWPIQNSIDLHGYTSEEARRYLFEFLQHALRNGFRCVNVIHGKGWRADGGEGILKIRVRHWLSQFPQVLVFCEPPANAGGAGAVLVLLKSTTAE